MKVFLGNLRTLILWVLIVFFLYVFVREWWLTSGVGFGISRAGVEGFTLPPVELDGSGNEKILSGGERTALFEDILRMANTNQDILKSMAPDLELIEFQVQKPPTASSDANDTRAFLATNLVLFVETALKPQEDAMNRRVAQYAGNSDVNDLSDFLRAVGADGIVSSDSRDRLETQLLKFVKKIVESHRRSLNNVQQDLQKEIENNQLAVSV